MNAKRDAVAALAMSGPSMRFDGSDFQERVGKVMNHALMISKALGLQK